MPDHAVDSLIDVKEVFNFTSSADEQFFRAMKEAFSFHYGHCEEYRKLCDYRGFAPGDLTGFELIDRIPWLFVTVLKERRFISVPRKQVALTLTSSGTTGQKSAIYLDRITLSRIRKIVWNIYASFAMADRDESVNYLCFTYDPRKAKDLGTAYSDKLLTGLTSVNKVYYAIRFDEQSGEFRLDKEGCWRALERFARSPHPFRILGFPSFLYEVLGEYARRRGKAFSFGDRSFVITGGGWKTLGDREVPKARFRKDVSAWLGIPPENIRDLFGMVEHGVPYCECEEGHFHVPIYSRAFVRSPRDLKILPYGETGIFHLLTPYLHSFPAISLLTTDVGRLWPSCSCGRSGPYMELLGRGGTRKHKGCAIAALDILEKAAP